MQQEASQARKLIAVKLLHTAIWALFVACILAIPVVGFVRQFRIAIILSGVVLAECLVLAANRCRCPLTDVAGRFTHEHTDNFDIYLPLWLAKYNKVIFGILFVAGELFVLLRWLNLR
jgi:hypothetical protein